MIDRIFIRPWLAFFTFIKRNKALALLLLALLFLLPTLMTCLIIVINFVLGLIRRFLGATAADAAAKFASVVITWMQNNSWGCPAFAIAIGIFAPLVGGVLTAWCIADKFKKGPQFTTAPETPAGDDDVQPPDVTDNSGSNPTNVLDDYWGSIYV